jgi:hypothetical protein
MRRTEARSGRLHALARRLRLVPQRDEVAAAELLGPQHALVDLLARRRALTVQALVTSVPLALAAIGIALDAASAPLLLGAAALVHLGLVVVNQYLRRRARELSEELTASGNGAARSLQLVEDEYRRLASPLERHRLAGSLERWIADARRWPRLGRGLPPPPGVSSLRFTVDEARDVVSLLRAGPADVRGVALTSRLLSDGGSSPLFGPDPEALREELVRIRFLLAASREGDDSRLAA